VWLLKTGGLSLPRVRWNVRASILLLTTCRSVRYENVSAVQSLGTGIIPLKPDKGEYGCLLIRPLLNRPSHPVNRCSRGSCVRISGPRSAAPRRWREYAPSEPMGPCSGTTKDFPSGSQATRRSWLARWLMRFGRTSVCRWPVPIPPGRYLSRSGALRKRPIPSTTSITSV